MAVDRFLERRDVGLVGTLRGRTDGASDKRAVPQETWVVNILCHLVSLRVLSHIQQGVWSLGSVRLRWCAHQISCPVVSGAIRLVSLEICIWETEQNQRLFATLYHFFGVVRTKAIKLLCVKARLEYGGGAWCVSCEKYLLAEPSSGFILIMSVH